MDRINSRVSTLQAFQKAPVPRSSEPQAAEPVETFQHTAEARLEEARDTRAFGSKLMIGGAVLAGIGAALTPICPPLGGAILIVGTSYAAAGVVAREHSRGAKLQ